MSSSNNKISALGQTLRIDWQLYLLLTPMVIWFIVFLYTPMAGLQIAFKDFSLFKGIYGSAWVGFEHFQTLFNDELFLRSIGNTFLISLYSLLFAFPMPIILALMFNELHHAVFKKTAQTIAYLPHFISVVIVAGMVVSFLSPTTGIVNLVLEYFGFEKTYFLTNPDYFRPIFIGSTMWKEAGFESIVYLAAIAGVNPSLYESARVDGASRWQQIWRITLPSILPTIIIMLIIRIGNLVEVGFEYIILLYQPATFETSDVISTFIYRVGLQGSQYDIATAAGLFNAVIAFILVYSANRISRKLSSSSLW
ncbi:ABC transporter permease [Marinobacterium rhizophilum]|uniref:Sugar ABC transporter permease n=1 Tax=Marinobacterium rhizophilum TaxID=420402 RepID=A0ABY5HDK8_9GAMM|nr:ABC transporter permease subunit [Marinobacterium rhizophilum]UTW10423.1 sugar ABC transporter permease [Marinobacterium rhizophilum]